MQERRPGGGRPLRREYGLRIARLAGGSALTALGVVAQLQANIGLEPWSIFQQGLQYTVGVSFGVASMLVGGAAIGIAMLLGEPFGFGTLGNTVICGVLIDWFCALDLIPLSTGPLMSAALLLGGMELIALGTRLYMSSCLGAGPRDSLTVALVRRTGFSVGLCRTSMEVLVTLTGWLMGGQLGIGTLVTAAGFGFLLDANFRLSHFHPTQCRQENVTETLRRLRARGDCREDA